MKINTDTNLKPKSDLDGLSSFLSSLVLIKETLVSIFINVCERVNYE